MTVHGRTMARWLHKSDCTTVRTAKYNKLSRFVCHANDATVYREAHEIAFQRFPRVRSSTMRLATVASRVYPQLLATWKMYPCNTHACSALITILYFFIASFF